MDVRLAELTKYAVNAMLATKFSFMNELANISEWVGARIEKALVGIGSASRFGYQFFYPDAGYGGLCFPTDVRALAKSACAMTYEADPLKSIETVNNRQSHRLFDNICKHFDGHGNALAKKFKQNENGQYLLQILKDSVFR